MKNIKYNFKSFFFEIESDIDLESDIISTIYPTAINHNNDENVKNPAQIKFKILKTYEDEFIIYKDEEKVFSCDKKNLALSKLEWIVTVSIQEKLSSFLHLHAGGIVTDNNKAMLIVADHGIGKSSIVIGLLLKGFKCLSDDIILVDTESLSFHCFPRAFKINTNLYKYLPELCNKTDLKTTITTDGNQTRRINPEKICSSPFSNSSEIRWTIFLTDNGSTVCNLRQIGQIEAFGLFIRGTFNINDHGYKGIDTITNIIEGSKCYLMNRGNLNDSISLLSNLLINEENNP